MRPGKQEYSKMAEDASPKSKSYITVPKAILIGGGICTIGQGLLDLWTKLGLDSEESALLVSISLVFCSALTTGLGYYDDLAKHGGAGTLVPITGFANAVVSPALEFKTEGMILGLGAKLFVISGPVIVYGITASFVYGVLYYFFG